MRKLTVTERAKLKFEEPAKKASPEAQAVGLSSEEMDEMLNNPLT